MGFIKASWSGGAFAKFGQKSAPSSPPAPPKTTAATPSMHQCNCPLCPTHVPTASQSGDLGRERERSLDGALSPTSDDDDEAYQLRLRRYATRLFSDANIVPKKLGGAPNGDQQGWFMVWDADDTLGTPRRAIPDGLEHGPCDAPQYWTPWETNDFWSCRFMRA